MNPAQTPAAYGFRPHRPVGQNTDQNMSFGQSTCLCRPCPVRVSSVFVLSPTRPTSARPCPQQIETLLPPTRRAHAPLLLLVIFAPETSAPQLEPPAQPACSTCPQDTPSKPPSRYPFSARV